MDNVNFEAKTNWVQDETVYPADANRWEQGIDDVKNLVNYHNTTQIPELEKNKVSKSGDTMTGALNVPTPSESENSTVVPTTAWVKKFLNDKLGKVYLSQSSLASDNSGALPLFTGETIASANTIYPDFYNWVLAHTELQCTSAEYESALSTYGECPKYVIVGGSLRLPKLSNYIKAANTAEGITQKEAGLPNITGTTSDSGDGNSNQARVTGAFFVKATSIKSNKDDQWRGLEIGFDASRSSAVYGASDTVTPAHTTLYPWVVAYAAAIPASEAQAAEFQQALSSKADVSLSNTTPSQTFKNMSVDWGAINFDSRIGFTLDASHSYTVPKNGFVFIQTSRAQDQPSNVKINGVEVCGSTAYWTNLSYNIPVCAGMVLSTSWSTLARAIFCPLKGVN